MKETPDESPVASLVGFLSLIVLIALIWVGIYVFFGDAQ